MVNKEFLTKYTVVKPFTMFHLPIFELSNKKHVINHLFLTPYQP